MSLRNLLLIGDFGIPAVTTNLNGLEGYITEFASILRRRYLEDRCNVSAIEKAPKLVGKFPGTKKKCTTPLKRPRPSENSASGDFERENRKLNDNQTLTCSKSNATSLEPCA